MLQRKMDSSADYGTPLVVSKKRWFQKFFDHKNIVEKIPVITSKVPDQNEVWNKLKYLARIETPVRIVGVVVLGTLLGAAYAVTTQSSDEKRVEAPVSAIEPQKMATQELAAKSVRSTDTRLSTSSSNALSKEDDVSMLTTLIKPEIHGAMNEFSFSKATITPEANDNIVLALKAPEISQNEVAPTFKLVSGEKSFRITLPKVFGSSEKVIDEATYTAIVIPAKLVPDVAKEGDTGLSEYEKKRIIELEKKLALIQKKLVRVDMESLKLQGKFETLVVKNRALSDQLRHIDTVTTELKKR